VFTPTGRFHPHRNLDGGAREGRPLKRDPLSQNVLTASFHFPSRVTARGIIGVE